MKERKKSSGICRNRYVIEVLGKEGARTDIWVARQCETSKGCEMVVVERRSEQSDSDFRLRMSWTWTGRLTGRLEPAGLG
jgi:hypothetical protein